MKISIISQNSYPVESITAEPLKVRVQISLPSSCQEILKDPLLYRSQEKTLIGKIDPSPTKNTTLLLLNSFQKIKKSTFYLS